MVIAALQKVFQNARYALLAFVVSIGVFVLALWLPNMRLIVSMMGHPGIPLAQKFDLPISLLGSIVTNFTLLSALYTVAIALLFGMNVAMITYFLRRRIDDARQAGLGTGFLGIVSGVLGMGCAACGSFLLTSALSLFGASWLLSYLPLNGGEFGVLGVILLVISLCFTAKKIQDPATCDT